MERSFDYDNYIITEHDDSYDSIHLEVPEMTTITLELEDYFVTMLGILNRVSRFFKSNSDNVIEKTTLVNEVDTIINLLIKSSKRFNYEFTHVQETEETSSTSSPTKSKGGLKNGNTTKKDKIHAKTSQQIEENIEKNQQNATFNQTQTNKRKRLENINEEELQNKKKRKLLVDHETFPRKTKIMNKSDSMNKINRRNRGKKNTIQKVNNTESPGVLTRSNKIKNYIEDEIEAVDKSTKLITRQSQNKSAKETLQVKKIKRKPSTRSIKSSQRNEKNENETSPESNSVATPKQIHRPDDKNSIDAPSHSIDKDTILKKPSKNETRDVTFASLDFSPIGPVSPVASKTLSKKGSKKNSNTWQELERTSIINSTKFTPKKNEKETFKESTQSIRLKRRSKQRSPKRLSLRIVKNSQKNMEWREKCLNKMIILSEETNPRKRRAKSLDGRPNNKKTIISRASVSVTEGNLKRKLYSEDKWLDILLQKTINDEN